MGQSNLGKVNKKIEKHVVGSYKKIEDGVLSSYKKIEDGAVSSFQKVTDKFVDNFLTREGETIEQAKERLATEQKTRKKVHKY